MRAYIVLRSCAVAAAALLAGCGGPQITTFTFAGRVNDLMEERGPSPNGPSSRDKLTVAIPSAVVWVSYVPKGKTAPTTERIDVWARSADEAEDRVDELEDSYEQKTDESFSMDVAEDFGAAMEPLAKRHFGGRFSSVEVVYEKAEGAKADLTLSLCQLTAPIPTDQALVVLCALPSSGGDELVALRSSPVKSAAGHLAWVIPGMILTFPIGVYFFGQGLRGITHGNGEDGATVALDAATGDIAARYAKLLDTGRVPLTRPAFRPSSLATITSAQRKDIEDGVTNRDAVEGSIGAPSMRYEVAGRADGCGQFAQYYARDGKVLSLVYKQDGTVCAHQ